MLNAQMISREELFNPVKILSVKISPSGHHFCEVRCDQKGTMNLFLEDGKALTHFTDPEIKRFYWSSDSTKIVFLKDVGGTRNFHIWIVDIKTKELKNCTEERELVLGNIYGISSTQSRAVVGIAGENPLYHDVYSLDLNTGSLEKIYTNSRFARIWLDDNLDIALKTEVHKNGAMTLVHANDEVLLNLSPDDSFHTTPVAIHGSCCTFLDTRTSDTTSLKTLDLKTGEEQILAHDPISDIGGLIFEGNRLVAYSTCYTKTTWHAFDPKVKSDLDFLSQRISTEFELLSQSADHNIWIVRSTSPLNGVRIFRFKRRDQTLTLLSQSPKIEGLVEMKPLVIPSRDGLNLVCYLTLPKHQKGPVPLILFPHGGPFQARDSFGFNAYHQWLASRGYAVLSVNFRLSSGFGKSFVTAGNGEWGGKAQDDLIDAANWCIKEKIADPEKIALFGGSYGGYAALAGLAFTPDYFACCVAACAPSNLKTVMQKVPLYWESSASPLSDEGV
ncbi:MAG: S9 family peptidase, partial [Simkania sp.]|nr:S9 family peptidase [Simkania sp.]